MFDILLTIPWWAFCIVLTFGSAGYGIAMRFIEEQSHPSVPCFIFTGISSLILLTICTIYIISGNAIEITWFGLTVAIVAGISLVGVDLNIIAMYKAGAPISISMPLIRIGMALLTAVIGIIFFTENITFTKILGISMGSIGIFLAIPNKK